MKHLFIAMLILSLAGISHADEAYTDLVSANGNADITSPTEPGTPVAVQKPYDPKDGKLIERPVPPDNDAPGYNPGDNKTVAPWLPGNVSAFLDVIAYAEGTQAYGPQDGYNVMFTHAFFWDYSRHPDIINCGGGWCSDAAGRYQFLFQTWEEVRRKLNLPDFSSISQDLAAVELIRRRWAYEDVKNSSDYNRFTAAIYKCNGEWASFPGSPYGQPTRTMAELWSHYQQFRQNYPQ